MSLADDKRSIFTTIGSYTSFMEQHKPIKQTDIFPSINNKKDVVPFLLDTLKTVAGTDSLKELMGGMITKLVASGETKIKKVLKNQFTQSNAGESLPNDFKTNGINLKVKDIDISGKLKVAPTSDVGKLMYQKTFDVDKMFHDAIANGGTTVSFAGLNVDCTYIESTDSFNIKPPASFNGTIGDYFSNYIDKTELVNENEIATDMLDAIYGTLKKKTKKTQAQILEELKVRKILEQIMNDNDSMLILPRDYELLQRTALELSEGIVNYDMGCGLMPASLSFESLEVFNTKISGSTDAYAVGIAFEETIDDSTGDNPQTTAENMPTIKDGFFQKLIKIFTEQMLYAATSQPQIRMLLGILSAFQNNGQVLIKNAIDDMKEFKIFLKCMVKDILNMIAEYIFLLAVTYMIELLTPVIKKILKEKINQFMELMKSLTIGSKVGKILETGMKAAST